MSHSIAWGNQLSQRLNCRVSNFGVKGYGTDQAYLRFRHNTSDDSQVVILGYFSDNIVRNVTRNFSFLYPSKNLGLKPRFILDDDQSLKLLRIPRFPIDELKRVADSRHVLANDYLAPGGPAGNFVVRFPYTVGVLRAFGQFRVKANRARLPFWAEFYEWYHPSRALQITTQIIRAFVEDATESGRDPIVVFFPSSLDFEAYRKNKRWIYEPLIDRLRKHDVQVLNIGSALMPFIRSRDPCSLYTKCPVGHFNRPGSELIARIVADQLVRLNLRRSRPAGDE
ncbi:MAG: hypothetical protein VCE43_00125 [Myxococcota bacterium]